MRRDLLTQSRTIPFLMLFITKVFHIETAHMLNAAGLSAAKAGSRMDRLEAERDITDCSVTMRSLSRRRRDHAIKATARRFSLELCTYQGSLR